MVQGLERLLRFCAIEVIISSKVTRFVIRARQIVKVTILGAKSETSLTRGTRVLPRLRHLAILRTIRALILLILHYELPGILLPEALEALFILLQLVDGRKQRTVVLALGY